MNFKNIKEAILDILPLYVQVDYCHTVPRAWLKEYIGNKNADVHSYLKNISNEEIYNLKTRASLDCVLEYCDEE